MSAVVRSVLRGSIQPLGRTVSGIHKQVIAGPVHVHALGVEGDAQADQRLHGGPDKAVHCYPWSHYATWQQELPGNELLRHAGAFGENLCVEGLDEHSVCMADRWRVGSTVLSVSQGRQPCFKLNIRFGVRDMAARVQQSLRAGWYLRVEQPGVLAAGDRMRLVERPFPQHSVAAVLALIRDRDTDPERLRAVLQLPLPPSWQRLFQQRLHSGQIEDWSRRMGTTTTQT